MDDTRVNFQINPDIKKALQMEALRRGVTVKDLVTKLIVSFLKANK